MTEQAQTKKQEKPDYLFQIGLDAVTTVVGSFCTGFAGYLIVGPFLGFLPAASSVIGAIMMVAVGAAGMAGFGCYTREYAKSAVTNFKDWRNYRAEKKALKGVRKNKAAPAQAKRPSAGLSERSAQESFSQSATPAVSSPVQKAAKPAAEPPTP